MADDELTEYPSHPPIDGALMLSFGAVQTGREALAVEQFTELSRYLGKLLADETITAFRPFFFADGLMGDVLGFFIIEGRRDALDALRRREDFVRVMLRAGAATRNVRVHTLVAGSQAGRLVHLYGEVRGELGLL